MDKRNQLLCNIRAYSLAVLDAGMFLNVNPEDKQALDYYKKYNELREREIMEYQKCYGPLTVNGNCGDTWRWVKGPWPWESEG